MVSAFLGGGGEISPSAPPLACSKNTFGTFLAALRFAELPAKLLRNFSESSNFASSKLKNDHKGHFLVLAEEERFELSLELSPH